MAAKVILALLLSVGLFYIGAVISDRYSKHGSLFDRFMRVVVDNFGGALVVSTVILTTAMSFIPMYFIYSDGTKTGILTKITQKGLIFKTYEGQLNLGGMVSNGDGGMVANVFNFSIKDEAIFKQLSQSQDKRVKLKYNQYLNVPIPVGDSNYIITEVIQ